MVQDLINWLLGMDLDRLVNDKTIIDDQPGPRPI
jgi:hypothetical protein